MLFYCGIDNFYCFVITGQNNIKTITEKLSVPLKTQEISHQKLFLISKEPIIQLKSCQLSKVGWM